jgi:hypothetical protein
VNNTGANVTGAATVSSGTVTNTGTFASTLGLTGGTFNNNAGGSVAGTTTNNGGTITNNGGTFATLTNNSGTVNASGGTFGAITNGAQFNVTGGTVNGTSFANNSNTAALNVTGGNLTLSGALTNAGAVTVSAGRTLTATGGVTNQATGTISNSGTIIDALDNFGVVTNNVGATYNANVTNEVSGVITNNGTWNGDLTNSGTVTNAGTWTTTAAGFANLAGGVINQTAGTIDATLGGFANAGIVNASAGAINGAISNNNGGTFDVTGTVTSNSTFNNGSGATLALSSAGNYGLTGALTNSGLITMANGSALSAGGVINPGVMTVTGAATLTSATLNSTGGTINLSGGSGSSRLIATGSAYTGGTVNAGTINLTTGVSNQLNVASATGNVNVLYSVTGSGATGLIPIVTATTANNTATGASGSTGFYQYQIVAPHTASNPTDNTSLFVNPAAAPAAGPLSSILSTISAIDASFHQPGGNLVASPQTDKPCLTPGVPLLTSSSQGDKSCQMVGGPWVRVSSGVTTISSTGTTSANGVTLDQATSKQRIQFTGVQAGADSGWLNLGGGGVNAHFGITGGEISAQADEQLSTPNQVKFEVPFVGVYYLITKGPFSTDFTYRHSWYDMHVTNPISLLNNAGFNGQSDNVNGSVSYTIGLPKNFFIEPTANLSYTRSTFNSLSLLNGGAVLGFNPVTSLLGRAGARIGTAFSYGGYNWSPFGIALVQNEFEKKASGTFTSTAPGSNPFDVTTDRVGTFYQTSLGLSFQSQTNGLLGFVRGDWRFGDKLHGGGLVGGVRYTFGP